jgi:HD-GYP domain-containing protein (c-di-GMP phosphodiesterase class II)
MSILMGKDIQMVWREKPSLLEARIIAVPDAFDAMASLRPHRGAMSLEDILLELEKYKGKQFDPKILEIFLQEKIYKS